MIEILGNRTYRHLFLAQLLALTGTGLATVALGLLAFELAGQSAGLVLGTALTIKMVAYVTLAPIAAAFADRVNRRAMLVALDLVRAGVALCLPFVSEVWQIYVLIFLLQSASAGFTPTFQATIPDVLPDEKEYTRALSLSRLAVDAESLLSPLLAGVLLTVLSFDDLFWGTGIGFVASAILVVSVVLPSPEPVQSRGIYERTTRGLRSYLGTPRLRGMLALNWVISATGSMVLVNTVVLVRGDLGLTDSAVAIALAGFGAGSMLVAIGLPGLLDRIDDRKVMLSGGAVTILVLGTLAVISAVYKLSFPTLCIAWFAMGAGFSAILTPTGRLLTRSAEPADRPSIFAAQFTLSHACWLVFYPLAGWVMTIGGATIAMGVLAALAIPGMIMARRVWSAEIRVP
ncbi:MAG: MFS transporter [Paracoccaceae bacterium]